MRREWRGVRDTFYDYLQWLRIWGVLIGFAAKPNNVKAFFRYRWMVNYLVVPDFFDRHLSIESVGTPYFSRIFFDA